MNNNNWPGNLIEAEWLLENLSSPGLRIFDATWFLPKAERSGAEEFLQNHLPGAIHFDYDVRFHREGAPFPRTMPESHTFEKGLRDLGLNENDSVVVYDNNGMFSSPRGWWMLKALGVKEVGVLNGGLSAWKEAGGKLESGQPKAHSEGNFKAEPNPHAFVDSKVVASALGNEGTRLLDARSGERFTDAHMPGADNLPYSDLLEDGFFRDVDSLSEYYDNRPLICTCGSGVTACVLALGATLAGKEDVSVYDASWSEWGKNDALPKEGDSVS